MWIEIVGPDGTTTVGAVNSETCDLIKIDEFSPAKAQSGALIRNYATSEVYKTKVSYLRLIETLTQSEASGLKQIANIVGSIDAPDPHKPRIVLAD